jgi:HAD superfamily hydrolase (TIGR01549 family)
LLVRTVLSELGRSPSPAKIEHFEKLHKHNFARRVSSLGTLPGARELLAHLSRETVPWAIGTSGDQKTVAMMIKPLRVPWSVPVVTGDVAHAKPHPDVFLAAANRLNVALPNCFVVGDSVWDLLAARRAKAIGIGLLSGGYGKAGLEQAGAYRVYKDPAEMLQNIGEIGIDSE